MQETINSLLVSLHRFLYPGREVIFIVGLLYSIVITFYYKGQVSKDKILQNRIIRIAMLHAGIAVFIVSYGATLEIQEPIFLDNLIILLPICTLLLPSLLVLFLWIGYYFASKTKNNNEPKDSKKGI